MADIRAVLKEVEDLTRKVSGVRQNTHGNVFASILACCQGASKIAHPDNARDVAMAIVGELVATIAEADAMAAQAIATMGRGE